MRDGAGRPVVNALNASAESTTVSEMQARTRWTSVLPKRPSFFLLMMRSATAVPGRFLKPAAIRWTRSGFMCVAPLRVSDPAVGVELAGSQPAVDRVDELALPGAGDRAILSLVLGQLGVIQLPVGAELVLLRAEPHRAAQEEQEAVAAV